MSNNEQNSRPSPFGTKTVMSIAFLLVTFMFTVFAVVYVTQVSITNTYQHFVELTKVQRDVDELTKALVDQETGQRGYQLTGLRPFLQPFVTGTATYARTSHRLLQEVDDTSIRPYIMQLIDIGNGWHNNFGLVQVGRKTAARPETIHSMEQGKAIVSQFRALSSQVDVLVASHQATDEHNISLYSRAQTYISFFLVIVLGTLILWIILRRFARLIEPINQLSVVVQQYATGHMTPQVSEIQDHELRQLIHHVDNILSEYRQRVTESDYLSNHDALTGLWSRRYFDEAITEVIRSARLCDEPLTMMMIDVDYFKQWNDLYGHLEGDRVLRTVGDVIAQQLRSTDVACRFGGEEFSILLPNTVVSDAVTIAERLRESVESTVRSGFSKVTISVGVSECMPHDTAETLITRSDSALYEAKQLGRNRVLSA